MSRWILLALGLITGATHADYATWTSGGGNSGSGSFPAGTMMPGFNWTITGDVSSISLLSGDPFDLANTFESAFGDASAAGNINPRVLSNQTVCGGAACSEIGAPITAGLTLTINFNSPTPTSGWGFALSDIDVDQVRIRATDSGGSPVPVGTIASWFNQTFDANSSSGTNTPSWDPAQAALIGSEAVGATTWQTNIVAINQDLEAPAGWFSPNVALNSLSFEFQSINSSGTPSFHAYLGVQEGAGAQPTGVPALSGFGLALLAGLLVAAALVQRRRDRA